MSNWVYCTLFTSVRILTADINWQKPAKILAISSQEWPSHMTVHTLNGHANRTATSTELNKSWESFVSRYCVKFQDDIMISSWYFMVRSLASAPYCSSSSESARKLTTSVSPFLLLHGGCSRYGRSAQRQIMRGLFAKWNGRPHSTIKTQKGQYYRNDKKHIKQNTNATKKTEHIIIIYITSYLKSHSCLKLSINFLYRSDHHKTSLQPNCTLMPFRIMSSQCYDIVIRHVVKSAKISYVTIIRFGP